MHINSDESMALGASFYGANISTAFRVRQVGLVDISPFAVGVTLEDLETDEEKKSDEDEDAWRKKATIFKANGKIGVKKTIAFTHDQDVHVSLDYSDPEKLPAGAKVELQRYKVSGVSAFAKEMEEKDLGKPKISLQFELSQSGTTALIKAEAAVEETYTVEVEVEIDDDDEEETVSTSNETSSSEDDKESKTEETSSSSEGESSETTTEEKSSPSEGESNETTTEDEKETENKTEGSAESQNDTSKEDISDKEEEPKKKKTKLVEKVCCLI